MPFHPPIAHFAIVLPVIASIFGLIYLIRQTEGMSKLSSRMLVFAAIAMIAAWYTGSDAGPKIYQYLSEAGKHELIEHKNLGLYLAIAFGIIAVLKFVGCQMKHFKVEAAAVILSVAATAMVFVQGKHGGEIVYQHGQPFKATIIMDTLNEAVTTADEAEECDEQVEAYEDAVDEITGLSEEIQEIYGAPEAEEEE